MHASQHVEFSHVIFDLCVTAQIEAAMLSLSDHYMVRNVNSLVHIICKESGM